ncbi:MAG: hypothetical protein R3B47_16960 [Bacteroidia bacterium]
MYNIQALNQQKIIIKMANVILIFCVLEVIGVLLIFKQTQYQLSTPLISQSVVCEVFAHYVDGGLIMAFALLLMVISKIFRQPVMIILIAVIAVILQAISHIRVQ